MVLKRYNKIMQTRYDRRKFLVRLSCIAFAGIRPWDGLADSDSLVRVAGAYATVYDEPSLQSKILRRLDKDEIVHFYYRLDGIRAPWYRIWNGYLYGAYLQEVSIQRNPFTESFNNQEKLVRVSVPYTDTQYLYPDGVGAGYRLYYDSTHWATGCYPDADGERWYRLVDFFDRIYWGNAAHFRVIGDESVTPLSPDIPPELKRIEVSITDQILRAFEDNNLVLETPVATGVPQKETVLDGDFSTETPVGNHHITVKNPSRHMGKRQIAPFAEMQGSYPGVPWCCFFHFSGAAIHGAYWHNNYGVQASHGCVNVPIEQACWLYRWTTPVSDNLTKHISDWGTQVVVF